MSSFQTEEEWRTIFLITAGVYAAGQLSLNLLTLTLTLIF